jgi:hypothetical protein
LSWRDYTTYHNLVNQPRWLDRRSNELLSIVIMHPVRLDCRHSGSSPTTLLQGARVKCWKCGRLRMVVSAK